MRQMGRNVFFEMFHIFIILFERFTEFLEFKKGSPMSGYPA